MAKAFEVCIEKGPHRVFAVAADWPGWSRSAPDETSALQALIDYGARYAEVIRSAVPSFKAPKNASGLMVVERLKGNSTTDYGAPGIPPSRDFEPIAKAGLQKLIDILSGCWAAFDATAKAAEKKRLSTGPRGGGRNLPKIRDHVLEGDVAYLMQVGARPGLDTLSDMKKMRKAFIQGLWARNNGELPDRGPRGGRRWTARYAIRRSAWHVLDHTWEIQDRVT